MRARSLVSMAALALAAGCATTYYDPYDPSTYDIGACNPAAHRSVNTSVGLDPEHSTAGHRSMSQADYELTEKDCANTED
jgi:hypothetical protein